MCVCVCVHSVSVVGLAAEVHVCRRMSDMTGGSYAVALNESHLTELMNAHAPPPPMPAGGARGAELVRQGPRHTRARAHTHTHARTREHLSALVCAYCVLLYMRSCSGIFVASVCVCVCTGQYGLPSEGSGGCRQCCVCGGGRTTATWQLRMPKVTHTHTRTHSFAATLK